jgi:hypothetical protein
MTDMTARPKPGTGRPAGMCLGPGHLVVYGNPAFIATFGRSCIGMPARETMLSLPPEAFDLLDSVLAGGRPLARWIVVDGEDWRMTATPRREFEPGDPYGVSFHLRRRSDLPLIRDERPAPEARREWLSPPSP